MAVRMDDVASARLAFHRVFFWQQEQDALVVRRSPLLVAKGKMLFPPEEVVLAMRKDVPCHLHFPDSVMMAL